MNRNRAASVNQHDLWRFICQRACQSRVKQKSPRLNPAAVQYLYGSDCFMMFLSGESSMSRAYGVHCVVVSILFQLSPSLRTLGNRLLLVFIFSGCTRLRRRSSSV